MVASRWPAEKRGDVSFHIRRVPASIADADQRFAVIGEPPVLARTGERRWTEDQAKRRLGWQGTRPETAQEQVLAVHGLVTDEFAARIATDLLRRPEVAARAMTGTTARHLVNRAQADQARQGAP